MSILVPNIGSFTAVPEPSSYKSTIVDLVDSGRNTQGMIVSNVIRSNIHKIELSWKYVPSSDWAAVMAVFRSNFVNAVRFWSTSENKYVTKNMYVGDRKDDMFYLKNGIVQGVKDCSLSLIEV